MGGRVAFRGMDRLSEQGLSVRIGVHEETGGAREERSDGPPGVRAGARGHHHVRMTTHDRRATPAAEHEQGVPGHLEGRDPGRQRIGELSARQEIEPLAQLLDVASAEGEPARRQTKERLGALLFRGEEPDPVDERLDLPSVDRIGRMAIDDLGCEGQVTGGCRLSHRGVELTVLRQPQRSPTAQRDLLLGHRCSKLGQQEVGEEVVVAEPGGLVLETDDEQVLGVGKLLEEQAAAGTSHDGVAERSGEPLEHGRAQEEVSAVRGKVSEELSAEVPVETADPDRELGQRSGEVVGGAEGQEVQVHGPRPPLAQVDEGRHCPGIELGEGPTDLRRALVRGEGQILAGQLEQLAAHLASGYVVERGRTTAEDQRRAVGDQAAEPVEHRRRALVADLVHVVEDEDHRLGQPVDGIGERCHHHGKRNRTGMVECELQLDEAPGLAHRGDDVPEEDDRVPIAALEGDPRSASLVDGHPLTHGCRLSVTGTRTDRDDAGPRRAQLADQLVTPECVFVKTRRTGLGREADGNQRRDRRIAPSLERHPPPPPFSGSGKARC